MAREHLLVVGWVGGGGGGWNREKLRDIPIRFRKITIITPLVAPFDVSDAFVADWPQVNFLSEHNIYQF